jgi:hypothetical protein
MNLRPFTLASVLILVLNVEIRAQAETQPGAAASSAAQKTAVKADPFSDPLIETISARHEKAVNGDAKETKALTTDLEKLTHEHPDNHLLQAFLGSIYTLRSRDAFPGPSKFNFLKDGILTMDSAVSADTTNPAVRLIRALDYYNLPAIFGRRTLAHDDFHQLLRWVDGEDKCDYQFNTETAQLIYYYAALCQIQESSNQTARVTLVRGWKLDPASPLAAKIHDELTKIGGESVL